MKYLFVHQNFPGQFVHLVRRLVSDPAHDVLFISEPTANAIRGVRVFTYRPPEPEPAFAPDLTEVGASVRRARIVQGMAVRLRDLGYVPDMIIGHHGWGEMLNLVDVWPGVPMLGYFEFYYRASGLDVGFDPEFPNPLESHATLRAKNLVNLLALELPGHGQTPTRFQHETYPAWARPRITVLPEGVALDACRPDPDSHQATLDVGGLRIEPGDILVTYVARDLEPYRGFHTMMRAVPGLLRLHARVKVIMIGGDGVSYGAKMFGTTWREHMLAELGDRIDRARIGFPGRIDYGIFLRVLQRSDAHVYLTYPFVLSWSLREALACGCAVVASDTAPVREFVTHGRNGLLVRFPDPDALTEGVARVLQDQALATRLRRAARRFAERHFAMDAYLEAYQALMARVMEEGR